MVQINDTSTIQDDGKGQKAFKGFLRYLWTFALAVGCILGFSEENYLGGSLYLVMAVAYFLFANNIAWTIGNTVRKWVMPEAFVGVDAMDSFKQKVFWNIGPQWFATMTTWLILSAIVELTSPVIWK